MLPALVRLRDAPDTCGRWEDVKQWNLAKQKLAKLTEDIPDFIAARRQRFEGNVSKYAADFVYAEAVKLESNCLKLTKVTKRFFIDLGTRMSIAGYINEARGLYKKLFEMHKAGTPTAEAVKEYTLHRNTFELHVRML